MEVGSLLIIRWMASPAPDDIPAPQQLPCLTAIAVPGRADPCHRLHEPVEVGHVDVGRVAPADLHEAVERERVVGVGGVQRGRLLVAVLAVA
jgi:hypothetical protein